MSGLVKKNEMMSYVGKVECSRKIEREECDVIICWEKIRKK